jgi:2'-5' RNA ligase
VCVPEAELNVSSLRIRFDPAAKLGVPAHITVLFPFKAPCAITPEILLKVRRLLIGLAPFSFRLADIGVFPGVVFLAPDPADRFAAITNALADLFPEHPPYLGAHSSVVPHLTVAHVAQSQQTAVVSELSAGLPQEGIFSFCHRVSLIENSSGRWQRMDAFTLGGESC